MQLPLWNAAATFWAPCMQILLSVLFKKKCRTVEFIEACEGLGQIGIPIACVKAAIPLPIQEFVVNLHERLRAVWRGLDGADLRTHTHKLATYY